MNIWPDQKLLQLASSFAQKCNWLTGKDNFWLSYQLIIVGGIIFMVYIYFFLHSVENFGLIGIMTLALILYIKTIEEVRARYSEVKIFEVEVSFLMIRLAFLMSSMISIISSVSIFLFPISPNRGIIFVNIWVLCWTLSLYVAGIEKPPFSKSKVWEWIKDQTRFEFPVLKPAPVNNGR